MSNTSTNILDIKNIEVMYDNVILALHDVSLKVPKGKVVALLGANGAGKSTTLKAVSTMLASERGKVTKGSINYDGTSIDKQNPSQMVGLGMVQVLEGRRCFGHLTVEENIISGAYSRKLSKGDINQELEKIYTYFIRLKERRKSQAAFTSGGEQQMIAVARAMMAKPKMLLLDEPTAGINPTLINGIIDRLIKVNQDFGITLLVIEHNMRVIMQLAESIYCLAHGKMLANGTPDEIKNDKRVIDAYLGAQ